MPTLLAVLLSCSFQVNSCCLHQKCRRAAFTNSYHGLFMQPMRGNWKMWLFTRRRLTVITMQQKLYWHTDKQLKINSKVNQESPQEICIAKDLFNCHLWEYQNDLTKSMEEKCWGQFLIGRRRLKMLNEMDRSHFLCWCVNRMCKAGRTAET